MNGLIAEISIAATVARSYHGAYTAMQRSVLRYSFPTTTLQQIKKSARAAYNDAGEHYDQYRQSGSNFFNSMIEMPAMLRAVGRDLHGKALLDIGCGTALHLSQYAKRGAQCAGLDVSATMIALARRRLPKCPLTIGSMVHLPYPDRSFDIVTCSLALHHVKHKGAVLREAARVLKPGGRFIFTVGNPMMDSRRSMVVGDTRINAVGTSTDMNGRVRAIGRYFNAKPILNTKTSPRVSYTWYPATFQMLITLAIRNGFAISRYDDCRPVSAARRRFPREYDVYSRIPFFCLFALTKIDSRESNC